MSLFPVPSLAQRLRRPMVPDRYDPEHVEPGPWSEAEEVSIPGAWIAAASSEVAGELVTTKKSLYCPPGFDIRQGDRVRAAGVTYSVDEVPSADHNPWTGWQPVLEVPLTVVADVKGGA